MEDKTIEKNGTNNTVIPEVQQNTAADYSSYVQDSRKPIEIRLPVGFFDCDKIRILSGQKNGSAVVNLYLNLIDIAAKSNRSGALFVADGIPYDVAMIANMTRCDVATVESSLKDLVRYGLLRQRDDVYSIVGFNRLIEFKTPAGRRTLPGLSKPEFTTEFLRATHLCIQIFDFHAKCCSLGISPIQPSDCMAGEIPQTPAHRICSRKSRVPIIDYSRTR